MLIYLSLLLLVADKLLVVIFLTIWVFCRGAFFVFFIFINFFISLFNGLGMEVSVVGLLIVDVLKILGEDIAWWVGIRIIVVVRTHKSTIIKLVSIKFQIFIFLHRLILVQFITHISLVTSQLVLLTRKQEFSLR